MSCLLRFNNIFWHFQTFLDYPHKTQFFPDFSWTYDPVPDSWNASIYIVKDNASGVPFM